MYAILVIRLKQSKSLHLIQTRLRCDDFDNTQLSWTLFFPLSCSWVSEVSIENFNWYFHSDFKLSRNFRTSNLHLKDFSLMHDVLLIFYPRTRQFLASGTKGGNSIWHEKKLLPFVFKLTLLVLDVLFIIHVSSFQCMLYFLSICIKCTSWKHCCEVSCSFLCWTHFV